MFDGIKKAGIGASIITLLMTSMVSADEIQLQEVKFQIGKDQYIVGEEIKKADVVPYIKNGRTMLPIRYVAEAVGVKDKDIYWEAESKTVTIFKENHIIQLTIGSDELIVDGKKIYMDTSSEIKDGRTMIPVSFIANALDIAVKWNNVSKIVTFNIERADYEDSEKKDLTYDYTYDQLLEKALEYDKDLKIAEAMVERADIIRDDAADDREYTPIGTGNGLAEAAASGALLKLKASDIQLEMAKKQIGIQRDKIAYNLKSAYYTVLESKGNEKLAKLAMDVAQKVMEQTNLKYEQGLASKIEKDQAKHSYEEAKKNYDLAKKAVENSYEKLNNLVGFQSDKRYTLDSEIIIDENTEKDLEKHIRYIITESPSIWMLEKQLQLKKLGVDLYVFNAGQDPFDAKEIDVKTAEMDLSNAKEKYEQLLRDLNSGLKQLQDEYEKLKIQLEQAEDTLNVASINFEIGNIIQLDVDRAKLQVENIKEKMRQNIMQHNKVLETYYKPWVATN